ncbi:hypothetical protein OIU74_021842 [Salix koriyanagi]|uniref:Uncharacterized protein n=1 Tax=Salix koriyanagi TaxID=2511006 RepID=A0A9Q0WLX5_9ROSI|nr:hypothetical protein OIU74_021842 [Salix koriyanagi]
MSGAILLKLGSCIIKLKDALSQPVNCNSRFSVMAGAREITGATKILFGNNRKTLYVQRDLPINRRNQLLLGMLRGHRPAFGVSNKRTVSLRFRAQSKPRDFVSGAVTSSVDEQSSLIEKPSWISIQKLGALRWLQKETYETENLGTGSFLEKKMKEGVDCGLTEVTRLGRSRRSLHLLKPVVWRKFDMFQSWREGEKHWRRLIRGWGLLLMCKIYSIILGCPGRTSSGIRQLWNCLTLHNLFVASIAGIGLSLGILL